MKAKFFLAAVLVLALSVGSANANPIGTEVNKTTMVQGVQKKGKAPMHHRHHRHRHHMMHH